MPHTITILILQYLALLITAMTITFGFGLMVTAHALVRMMR
jgi:hypothetical protein